MLNVKKPFLSSIKFAGLFFALSSFAHAQSSEFEVNVLGQYDVPWALEFLPDDRLLLSEMSGALKLLEATAAEQDVRRQAWLRCS